MRSSDPTEGISIFVARLEKLSTSGLESQKQATFGIEYTTISSVESCLAVSALRKVVRTIRSYLGLTRGPKVAPVNTFHLLLKLRNTKLSFRIWFHHIVESLFDDFILI